MEQCWNNSKQCRNNAPNALLRSKLSLRIVSCYIALKLPKDVDGFSILKITRSSFESSICIFFVAGYHLTVNPCMAFLLGHDITGI